MEQPLNWLRARRNCSFPFFLFGGYHCGKGAYHHRTTYLGMQFDGVRSTSQAANSFIGTGLVMAIRSNFVPLSAIARTLRFVLVRLRDTTTLLLLFLS